MIHTASIIPNVKMQGSRALDIVNVDGTRNVISTCQELGIPRIVYTSSATVVGMHYRSVASSANPVVLKVLGPNDWSLCGVDESHPYPEKNIDSYGTTKRAAEIAVLSANSAKLATCALRPACVFGEGDKLVSDYYVVGENHYIIGTGKSQLDWVYVDNVATAHVLAENTLYHNPSKVAGKAYFIGSSIGKVPPKYNHGEFVGAGPADSKSHWGIGRPQIIPLWIIMIFAFLNEILWSLLGFTFDDVLCRTTLLYTQRSYYFDCSAAERDFGYRVNVSVDEAISRIVQSYRDGTHVGRSPQAKVKFI